MSLLAAAFKKGVALTFLKLIIMSRSIGSTLLDVVKNLFISLLKLCAIAFAWLCKIAGMILLKTGETIEKMITK